MVKAKTIEIYLPTGDASEISETRIKTEAIKVVYLDKAQLEAQKNRLKYMGCYVLVGKADDGSDSVYIGETEDLYSRLTKHKRKKTFWSSVYTVQNSGGTFDKAHLTYLEKLMIEKANDVDRYGTNNNNTGKITKIPEAKQNECLLYFETIKSLFKTLAFNLFVPEVEKEEFDERQVFYFKDKKEGLWNASGVYVNEKFTVLKGSISRMEPLARKVGSSQVKFKDRLIKEGIIKENNNQLVFQKDYTFNSPSTAASIVSLRSNNGWKVWKTINNETLDQIFPRQ